MKLKRIIVNRWFRANGQRKRVDSLFDHFWDDALAMKVHMFEFNSLKLTIFIKNKYQTSLVDALDMMVAFIGHYDNDKQSRLFSKERYDHGMRLWQCQLSNEKRVINA